MRSRSHPGHAIGLLRAGEVLLRQPALAVGPVPQRHGLVADRDVGMMVDLLGVERDADHERDGLLEGPEREALLDRLAFDQRPVGNGLEALFDLTGGQGRHGLLLSPVWPATSLSSPERAGQPRPGGARPAAAALQRGAATDTTFNSARPYNPGGYPSKPKC